MKALIELMNGTKVEVCDSQVVEENLDLLDYDQQNNISGYRVFVIGNEFGVLCLVVANSAEEAIDLAIDNSRLDSHIISQDDFDEEMADDYLYAGNNGIAIDTTYLWVECVKGTIKRSIVVEISASQNTP